VTSSGSDDQYKPKYMFLYVIKRLILILPTLLLVLIVSFFITKSVPGDQATAMLNLQGVNLTSPNAAKEYARNYKALGLNLPNFYVSVLPDYYPDNLNAIIDEDQRKLTSNLLSEGIPMVFINDFLAKKKEFLTKIKADTTFGSLDIKPLLFASKLDDVRGALQKLSTIVDLSNDPNFNKLSRSIQDFDLHQRRTFYPVISWHGVDNQFHRWISFAIKGQLGISIKDGQPISQKIVKALRWTILLLGLNMVFTLLIVVPLGLFTGNRPQGFWDQAIGFISLILYSIPTFWLATMLIFYFTGTNYGGIFKVFPTPGLWSISGDKPFLIEVFSQYEQLILPVICLVANDVAFLSRLIRNNVIAEKQSYYYEYAIAKGLTSAQAIRHHLLPNILVPLITLVVNAIPAALSGALLIEVIFNIPGMGRLMYDSIYSYDWSVVLGILSILSIATIVFMLIADLSISWVNPKIKQGEV